MAQPFDDIDQLAVNTVRTLAVDAVEQAKSGHPGLPLGCAPMAHVLWTRHLRYNPADPPWPGRDRFVLSAGHGCMLLYSLLHLTGYDLPLEELKRFRQWGSMTPGHPEYGHTPGVETTTGPLGQGAGNAIGMAIAGKHLEAQYGAVAGFRVFAIVSDGDLMEGVCAEAASLAGHLALDNLVFLYDDNHVSIDGDTSLAFTEQRAARFAALGWHTTTVANGNDLAAIDAALQEAIEVRDQPSLVDIKTIIGFGSRDAGTSRAHSDARGPEQQAETKRTLGFDPDQFFVDPRRGAGALPRGARPRGLRAGVVGAGARRPSPGRRAAADLRRQPPRGAVLPGVCVRGRPDGHARSVGQGAGRLAPQVPELVGGSADLTPSNNTRPPDAVDFQPGTREGRYLHFGVREHGMGAVVNGLTVSHLRAYGGTFFNFMDYMKPSVRLSALMNIPCIWVYTHDSVGLGEDGPTHQPIEQLATLRATPNMTVFRPADANETAVGWRIALERRNPTALVLSRQALPVLDAERPAELAAPRRLRPGGRGRSAGAADRHRFRGARRDRGPGAAARPRRPQPGGLAALVGAVRGAAPGLPRRGAATLRRGPRGRRGRVAIGLGALRRHPRGDHRPRPFRRVGSRADGARQPRIHRAARRRGGAARSRYAYRPRLRRVRNV